MDKVIEFIPKNGGVTTKVVARDTLSDILSKWIVRQSILLLTAFFFFILGILGATTGWFFTGLVLLSIVTTFIKYK